MEGKSIELLKTEMTIIQNSMMITANFWLNEIKSKDDSIRLLINTVIVLIIGYNTIIIANFEKIKGLLSIDIYTLAFLLMTPTIVWFFSFSLLALSQMTPPRNMETLLESNLICLVDLANRKARILIYSYVFVLIPVLLFAFLYLSYRIVYNLNPIYLFLIIWVLIFASVVGTGIYLYFLITKVFMPKD